MDKYKSSRGKHRSDAAAQRRDQAVAENVGRRTRASRVNNIAACTGIQSLAAAMGAGPLGSVTLPVWAQPWYALHNPLVCVVLGVGPKFEPNKFGGVGKKASKQHNSDDRDAKCGSRWSQRRRESRHQATTRSPPARGAAESAAHSGELRSRHTADLAALMGASPGTSSGCGTRATETTYVSCSIREFPYSGSDP
jgi:hypothetical protein